MKILVTCKLEDVAIKSHLVPISLSKKISEIYVVRDIKGPQIDKVRYYHLHPLFRLPLIRIIAKLVLLIFVGLKKKPDLIYSFFFVPHGINAIIAAKILRRPVGVALIGSDLRYYLTSKYRRLLFKFLKYSDIIVTYGNKSKNFLVNNGIDEKKIFFIRNFLNIDKFCPKITKKEYDLIFVGRFHPVKRIDVLLNIISKVKGKNKDVKLVLVGDGPLRNKIENLVKKLNLSNNVIFAGYKNNIQDYLNKSKIFILTSESEGLPFSMIEAMCCGIIPLVPDVGDIRNIAINNFNSIVVEPLNVDKYSNSIVKLLNNSKFYNKLRKNALKVRNKYAVKNVTELWDTIANKIRV